MVNNTLRERKRAETRQRISDCATRLFERDGFENVTLAQVAAAADVSVKTVTNYFGAKEDLFFDAEPAILEALLGEVQRSDPSTTPTTALRPQILDGPILTAPRLWAAVDADSWQAMRAWTRCEHDSPTLRNRRAAILQSWSDPLAVASGSAPWAALMVGVLLLRHDLLQKGLLDGAPPHEVERRIRNVVGQALDALEQGFKNSW